MSDTNKEAIKIDESIVGYSIKDDSDKEKPVEMHEALSRPDVLSGKTYKIKPPSTVSEHAIYITINDMVLNEGTEHEEVRPFEVFINCLDVSNLQWIIALTRVISAVFRKGGQIDFLAKELKAIFDPKGGYWNKGKYVTSLVAEIGMVIEQHMLELNVIKRKELTEAEKKLIEEKAALIEHETIDEDGYPTSAVKCKACGERAVVVLDNCATCLACADSKCG